MGMTPQNIHIIPPIHLSMEALSNAWYAYDKSNTDILGVSFLHFHKTHPNMHVNICELQKNLCHVLCSASTSLYKYCRPWYSNALAPDSLPETHVVDMM